MLRDPHCPIGVNVCVCVCVGEMKVLPTDLNHFVQAAGHIADQGSRPAARSLPAHVANKEDVASVPHFQKKDYNLDSCRS